MMVRLFVSVALAGLVLSMVAVPEAAAQKKKIEVSQKWNGSVEDEKLMKDAPQAITSQKSLEALWKTWKVAGDAPKVDFTKNIVVAVYSVGSGLNFAGLNLDEKGNLSVGSFGTRDIRPGFRYVLGAVSKDGVKTVNGKELPKE
jgi:hypothetical protein